MTTLAGTAGSAGTADGTGAAARFYWPSGVTFDGSGNLIVADSGNNTIRKITPGGVVTTLAGTPGVAGDIDGPAASAQFSMPYGVVVERDGSIDVADGAETNAGIRHITAAGIVQTLSRSGNQFQEPFGVALDANDNLYVADYGSHVIVQGFHVQATASLANISSRGQVGAGSATLIAGFVVSGTTPKSVLLRAAGPTLASYGITGPISQPVLTLYQGSNVLASNQGWSTSANAANLAAAAMKVGAFSFAPNSGDSALLASLNPGIYSATITGGIGTSLAEVYDTDGFSPSAGLVNLSTRGQAGTGDQVLILGVVVSGTRPKKLLIRAVGPSLTGFGVPGALVDPQLQIFQGAVQVAQNAGWKNDDLVRTADALAGAFDLPLGSNDAAMVIVLNPGAYTAVVSSRGAGPGTVLVEVYDVPWN